MERETQMKVAIQPIVQLNRKRLISLLCVVVLIAMGGVFIQKVLANSDAYAVARQALLAETDAPVLLPVIENAEPEIISSEHNRYAVNLVDSTVVCPQYESCHLATVSVKNLSIARPRRNEDVLIQLENGIIAQFFAARPPEVPTFLVFEIDNHQYVLGIPEATEEEIVAVANRMFEDEN